ncbi:hypothetical protein PGTUg99_024173 [Puccinia graminis f. sp. tritici]|uniref:Uncharacterized protein n=1 Tax=Puccinia graminis f. sp. tritici TaxID=56615 RepID=A0A5B0PES9_PUCGR|nr:hypothetical protein PGTUg99_024173 [Puccinia graminis f. sp. tritici]
MSDEGLYSDANYSASQHGIASILNQDFEQQPFYADHNFHPSQTQLASGLNHHETGSFNPDTNSSWPNNSSPVDGRGNTLTRQSTHMTQGQSPACTHPFSSQSTAIRQPLTQSFMNTQHINNLQNRQPSNVDNLQTTTLQTTNLQVDTLQMLNLLTVNTHQLKLQPINFQTDNLQVANLQVNNLQTNTLRTVNNRQLRLQPVKFQTNNLQVDNLQTDKLRTLNLQTINNRQLKVRPVKFQTRHLQALLTTGRPMRPLPMMQVPQSIPVVRRSRERLIQLTMVRRPKSGCALTQLFLKQ